MPPLAYVPLCSSSDPFRPVVRIPPDEVGVFVTRERASALLLVEVVADRRRRRLSQLFEAVRAERSGTTFDALRQRQPTWLDQLMRRSDAEDESPPPPSDVAARLGGAAAAAAAEAGSAEGVADGAGGAAARGGRASREEVGRVGSLDQLYGEPWADKVERIRRASPHGRRSGWALVPLLSKANDDVRQEVFVMQLLRLLERAFPAPLWLRPYAILSTGPRSGLIEFSPNTQSLHALKKLPRFGSLEEHFRDHYGDASSPRGAAARHNFVSSLAAYSIATYLLGVKDRHNGNILLDRDGHLIHIDFGFVLGRAPGGRAALEAAVPFKLTREMVGVLGGPTAPLFTETLVDLCTSALRAARAHADSLLALIEMTGYRSDMLCFASGVETPLRQARRAASGTAGASAPPAHASAALVRAAQVRDRLMLEVPEEQLRERVEQLVSLSYNNVYTRAYDEFQRWSNGIAC